MQDYKLGNRDPLFFGMSQRGHKTFSEKEKIWSFVVLEAWLNEYMSKEFDLPRSLKDIDNVFYLGKMTL